MTDIHTARIEPFLTAAPVVPVVTVETPTQGIGLARALVAGGLPSVEVTLRTSGAMKALEAIAHEVPKARVGAGTVMSRMQAEDAVAAGAKFLVSPGATDSLLAACEDLPIPMLPGAATASEIMRLHEAGYRRLKFFPAGPAGGPAMLKAWGPPIADVKFCPTGGVSLDNATEYLSLPNVLCVGGSWVAPGDAVSAGDWARIEALAKQAAALSA